MISLELDLQVNYQSFRLGDELELSVLAEAQCKKAGFLSRRMAKAAPDQTLYWAKNPCINAFDEKWVMLPTMEFMKDTTPIDQMCATSAYLYFGPNGLEKATLQTFGSELAATAALWSFTEICSQRYGDPDGTSDRIAIWNRDGTVVALESSGNRKKAWLAWTVDDREVLAS